jgi:hypothetical protein
VGAKLGATVFRLRPTQRDALRVFAQVRRRDPRFGFAQVRACLPGLLRDEEAVDSIPPPQMDYTGKPAR